LTTTATATVIARMKASRNPRDENQLDNSVFDAGEHALNDPGSIEGFGRNRTSYSPQLSDHDQLSMSNDSESALINLKERNDHSRSGVILSSTENEDLKGSILSQGISAPIADQPTRTFIRTHSAELRNVNTAAGVNAVVNVGVDSGTAADTASNVATGIDIDTGKDTAIDTGNDDKTVDIIQSGLHRNQKQDQDQAIDGDEMSPLYVPDTAWRGVVSPPQEEEENDEKS
jgi:hypothetical protein